MMYMVNRNVKKAMGRAIGHNLERKAAARIASSVANASISGQAQPGHLRNQLQTGILSCSQVGRWIKPNASQNESEQVKLA
jgi:hypothetical protein